MLWHNKAFTRIDFRRRECGAYICAQWFNEDFFAKTLQLYGQGKADKVKDVVADIAGSIDIKDEHGNVVLPVSIYVSNCEEPDSETPKNITSFLADSVLKQQYDDILKTCLKNRKHCSRTLATTQEALILYQNLFEHSVKASRAFSIASLRK